MSVSFLTESRLHSSWIVFSRSYSSIFSTRRTGEVSVHGSRLRAKKGYGAVTIEHLTRDTQLIANLAKMRIGDTVREGFEPSVPFWGTAL